MKIQNVPKKVLTSAIIAYQKTISPDHGLLKSLHPYGFCRFHPTCSEYGRQAIEEYGCIKGGYLSAKRIIRCNPWNSGGEDPIPKQKTP